MLEKEAEDFLEKNKFNIVNRSFIKNKSQLDKVNLSFPWVMKVYSKSIIHKNKHGGIIQDINSIENAQRSYTKLSRLRGFNGIIIQETLRGQELILGLKNTKDFGLTILLGAGGTNVEKIKDVTFRVLPISKHDAISMINDLKIKIINKSAIIKNLIKLNKLAKHHQDIQELDINPIIINKQSATIVDVRIIKS